MKAGKYHQRGLKENQYFRWIEAYIVAQQGKTTFDLFIFCFITSDKNRTGLNLDTLTIMMKVYYCFLLSFGIVVFQSDYIYSSGSQTQFEHLHVIAFQSLPDYMKYYLFCQWTA